MNEIAIPEGVVAGGWSFVISGYAITAVVLLSYAWSLWRRLRNSTAVEGER